MASYLLASAIDHLHQLCKETNTVCMCVLQSAIHDLHKSLVYVLLSAIVVSSSF